MRKVLSLVLALSLVLGTMPMSFAAEMAVDQTAGEILKGYEMISGDETGNLNEDQKLTRAAMMKLIAAMLGVEEEAKNYPLPSTFTDVPADAWYAGYVAYAQNAKWSNGIGDGLFDPEGEVTAQMAAKFMLTALGYEVNWETALEDAAAVGIMEGVEASEAPALRGEVFQMMVNTLNQNKAGEDVKLGVDLGVMEPEAPEVEVVEGAEFDVQAVGNEKVEVRFAEDAEVDADAAANVDSYVITEKADADKVLEVVSVYYVADQKVAVLETEAQTNGKAYTLTIGENTDNFAGLKAVTDKPEVDDVDGTDTNTVEVTFTTNIDKETAENIDNYYIAGVEVVKAVVDEDDKRIVKVYTEGMDRKKSRKITIENVESADGVVMKKTTENFVSDVDDDAPELKDIDPINNIKIEVIFKDDNGVDKASAEDIANYNIKGLEIVSIEAKRGPNDDEDEDYDRVEITTEEQTKSKYDIEITGIVDGSYAANVMTKTEKDSFRSKDADEDEPELDKAVAKNGDEIWVYFDEDNNLDPVSALDVDNYEIKDDDLDIYEAKFKDDDEDEKIIILSTSTQDEEENYKLYVENVEDEFGNIMKRDDDGFDGSEADSQDPYVTKVNYYFDDDSSDRDNDAGNIKDDDDDKHKVKLTFNEDLKEDTAEDPTNYDIEGLGSIVKAKYHDEDENGKSLDKPVVILTIQEPDNNASYDLTVEGLEDRYGNAMDDYTVKFTATINEDDTEKPEIDDVEAINVNEIRVDFSEDVIIKSGTKLTLKDEAGNFTTADFVALMEDESVAVFRHAGLEDNEEYSVMLDTSKVTDKAGNNLDSESADYDEEFDGTDEKVKDSDSYLELGSGDWEQEDVKTFIFEFDEEFLFQGNVDGATGVVDGDKIKGDVIKVGNTLANAKAVTEDWIVDYGDDNTILELTAPSKIADETVIVVDFSQIITNMVGGKVKNVDLDEDLFAYDIEADEDDDDDPYLEDIKVLDNKTIELIYNENLDENGDGTYKITDDDEDDDELDVDKAATIVDDNTVTLRLKDKLESGHTYTLEVTKGAKDLSGNREEEDEKYSFDGTDKEVESTVYITGVEITSDKAITVNTSKDLNTSAKFEIYKGDTKLVLATTGHVNADGSTGRTNDDYDILLKEALVDGVDYTVKVSVDYGTLNIPLSYEFEGVVADGDIDIDFDDNTKTLVTVTYGDYDSDDGYSMTIATDATASNTIATVKVGGDAAIDVNADEVNITTAKLTDDVVKVTFKKDVQTGDVLTVNILDASGRIVYTYGETK